MFSPSVSLSVSLCVCHIFTMPIQGHMTMLIGEEICTIGQGQFLMPNSMENSNMISDLTKNFIQVLGFKTKNCHFWVYFSDFPYKKDITSECSNLDTIRSTEMLCTSLESCECHLSKNIHNISVFPVSYELWCSKKIF